MLKVGIAGYGVVGRRRRVFIDKHPHLKTIAVCDKTFTEDGIFDDGDIAENDTIVVKYTMGSMTAAIQSTNVDYEAQASTDQDATHMGISMAINDDLTVSAGRQEVEFDGGTEDEVNTGIQASYTMGSISFSTAINSVESAGGTANKDAEASIFVASFAF